MYLWKHTIFIGRGIFWRGMGPFPPLSDPLSQTYIATRWIQRSHLPPLTRSLRATNLFDEVCPTTLLPEWPRVLEGPKGRSTTIRGLRVQRPRQLLGVGVHPAHRPSAQCRSSTRTHSWLQGVFQVIQATHIMPGFLHTAQPPVRKSLFIALDYHFWLWIVSDSKQVLSDFSCGRLDIVA